MSFQFDFWNFLIGFLAGIAATIGGIRLRRLVHSLRQSFDASAARPSDTYAARRGDRRYINALIRITQTSHMAGQRAELSDLLVLPRFFKMPPLVEMPDEEETTQNIWDAVPLVHDMPFLHAPYNVPTLGIAEISRGERALAILGKSGSGRTTALMAIALYSMGQIDLTPPPDTIQAELDSEESKLTPEERAERIRARMRARQDVQQRMEQEKGLNYAAALADEDAAGNITDQRSPFLEATPIYVHLTNIRLRDGRLSRTLDPAEPLIRAVQAQIGGLAARTTPRSLYRAINNGRALLLLDGYDEVPADRQPHIRAWIKALMEMHGRNFIIITGAPEAYEWMNQLHIQPVHMAPWRDAEIHQFAERWAAGWPRIGGEGETPGEEIINQIKAEGRGLHPYELMLWAWGTCAGYADNQSTWVEAYFHDNLPDAEQFIPNIQRLARLQLEEHSIRLDRLVALELETPIYTPYDQPEIDEAIEEAPLPFDIDNVEALHDETTPDSDPGDTAEDEKSERNIRQVRTAQRKVIHTLQRYGILVQQADGSYRFRHNDLAAYGAGLSLAEDDDTILLDKAQDPDWHTAIAYASQHMPIEPAIVALLQKPRSVLHSELMQAARWMAYADPNATWRDILLRQISNIITAEAQYTLVRERLTAALVSTRDEGTVGIFRRMLNHPEEDVRRLGCLGIGAMRDEGSAGSLLQMLYDDDDKYVQVAAALALGLLREEASFEALIEMLETSDNADIQRAITETLAADRETGYPLLYGALQESEDAIMLRRAVLFGLGRVRANWALIAINDVINDGGEEYFVRSAAEEVFLSLYTLESEGVRGYPALGSLPWLISWSREQIELGELPHDADSLVILQAAIQQSNDPLVRVLAIETTAQLGIVEAVPTLYRALADSHPVVRDAAYRALATFAAKSGQALEPAV